MSGKPQVFHDGESLTRLKVSAVQRLIGAVQELSLARDLSSVCEIVRSAARVLTGADGATFVLRDRDRCFYVDEDAIGPLWKGKRFPMSACISGWVMNNAQSVVLPDIYADARIPHEAYQPTFVKSMAMVPIRTANPIGAIGNYWATQRKATRREVTLLQALADSTSVALENIQVYNELEHRVKERTNQLQLMNRELEAFASSVSHDLRAPLSNIIGFAGLLAAEDGLEAHPRWRQYVQRIGEASGRMNELIDDLLHLAQVTRDELVCQAVDLAEIAREVVARQVASHPQRPLSVMTQPSMPGYGDARLLRIVFDNLLSNSWKYTSKRENAAIEIGMRLGPTPVYFVRDNGAGFDMKNADRLFAPFQRLHSQSEYAGTGVGLTTVQRIIHKHGGEIWAESAIDAGATFSFTLPPRVDRNTQLVDAFGRD